MQEQTTNTPPEPATNEPASPSAPTPGTALSLAAISQRLSASIDEACAVPATIPDRATRHDGWTPEAQRIFLETLAQGGIVVDAARAAGMTKQAAYSFRNSARGRAFDVAWRAALILARRRVADEAVARAIHGSVDVIMRHGEVWGERHRHDNRLTMAVLARLDAQVKGYGEDEAPARAAEEFDALIDAVCAGAEEAADFIHSRCELPYADRKEPHIIWRNDQYARGENADLAGDEEGEEKVH
jgi:hypothetical protein